MAAGRDLSLASPTLRRVSRRRVLGQARSARVPDRALTGCAKRDGNALECRLRMHLTLHTRPWARAKARLAHRACRHAQARQVRAAACHAQHSRACRLHTCAVASQTPPTRSPRGLSLGDRGSESARTPRLGLHRPACTGRAAPTAHAPAHAAHACPAAPRNARVHTSACRGQAPTLPSAAPPFLRCLLAAPPLRTAKCRASPQRSTPAAF